MGRAKGKSKAHIIYRLVDKTIVPGITTVLGLHSKKALINWANRLGLEGIDVNKYVDNLADIGVLAHALVTNQLIGKKTDLSNHSPNQISLAENSALSFWEWEKDHPIEEVFFVEKPLVSEKYKFGGTGDIYCQIKGNKEIIDLKTGSGIYPEHTWQVATLKPLLEENGFPVDATRIVNIPRAESESFLEKTVNEKENEIGFKIFLNLLNVYYLKKELK